MGGSIFHAEDYEPMIGATTEVLTHKVIYYASDYPHWDTEFPENIAHLEQARRSERRSQEMAVRRDREETL